MQCKAKWALKHHVVLIHCSALAASEKQAGAHKEKATEAAGCAKSCPCPLSPSCTEMNAYAANACTVYLNTVGAHMLSLAVSMLLSTVSSTEHLMSWTCSQRMNMPMGHHAQHFFMPFTHACSSSATSAKELEMAKADKVRMSCDPDLAFE